jgi:hypothetical protein
MTVTPTIVVVRALVTAARVVTVVARLATAVAQVVVTAVRVHTGNSISEHQLIKQAFI